MPGSRASGFGSPAPGMMEVVKPVVWDVPRRSSEGQKDRLWIWEVAL